MGVGVGDGGMDLKLGVSGREGGGGGGGDSGGGSEARDNNSC